MNSVFILSPHFPPSSLAGVHRARHLAKHLPAHGWTPLIVRVDEKFYTERSDPNLAGLTPTTVAQLRTAAIPATFARLVGIGDIGLRGYFPIKNAIQKAAETAQPDVLLITGAPFYPMLLAQWARRVLNIPVVLDFQDPWVSAEGATRSLWTKGGIAHLLATLLEPRAVRSADFITSVSDRQNHEMAERYPWLDLSRMAAIPIGGDPEDFDALRKNPPARQIVRLDSTMINLSYVGTCLPRAGPLVRTIFCALRELKQSSPALAARLKVHFVGTSNQPDGHGLYRIRQLAEEEGVGDLVTETPQRVPFLEALHILANSNGLLLIGSDEPHYTASKIYPALMSSRPYISLFHEASSAHAILQKAGGGKTFSFGAVPELAGMIPDIVTALCQLAGAPESLGRADPGSFSAYTASSVAGSFASVFDNVSGKFGRKGALL